jgi:hypothetical protein
MRKLMILLTLAVSYIAVAGSVRADLPPTCDPICGVR